MDPSKKIGQIKEQVERENVSRRRYPEKWGKLAEKDVNRFYNQNEVNKIIRGTISSDSKTTWPYSYTRQGESYFMSKDMYESLVAKCRCGRSLAEGHAIKCLQRAVNTHLTNDRVSAGSGGNAGNGKYHNDTISSDSIDDLKFRRRIPETTNGVIGWVSSRYSEWERSAKYVSPVTTMPGHRITAHPYNVIFIG